MKKYRLLLILIVMTVLISIPGLYLNICDRSFKHPAAAVMIHAVKNNEVQNAIPGPVADLLGLHNSKADIPDDISAVIEASAENSSLHKSNDASSVSDNESDEVHTDASETDAPDKDTGADAESEDEDGDNSDDEEDVEEDDEGEEEENVFPKEFTTVDDDYFTDACFLGDSRVQGLGLYSDLPAVNYGVVSMQLYKVFERKAISTEVGKVTVAEKLTMDPPYGKVYLKFGLNELGWGNNGLFEEYYYTLIDYIKAVEPDATIYVMSVIHVTAGEEASSSVFNNDAINRRNEVIKEIAENEHVYYLDLNEVFTDENGCLPTEDSFDGIHIRAQAMYKWVDYLKTHAIE
jgi:hypothetical protein